MSLVDDQDLFLQDVARLLQYAHSLGFQITGGELWRTAEQQKIYFDLGKSKTPTNSKHLSRLAIDLNFFKGNQLVSDKETLKPLGWYWEQLSAQNKWGGNWLTLVDLPHFERQV